MRETFDITIFDGVYPPSEDTYLLIDSLTIRPDDIVLDMGCGIGLVTLIASERAKQVLSIDISLEAVRNTKENLKRNNLGMNVSVIQSDLLSPFSLNTNFSLVLFNPPYLPADEDQTDMDHTLIGGVSGIELTERFIIEVTNHLMDEGRIYVVISSLSDRERIIASLHENNFETFIEREESLFFERIQVLKGVWHGHKETVL